MLHLPRFHRILPLLAITATATAERLELEVVGARGGPTPRVPPYRREVRAANDET